MMIDPDGMGGWYVTQPDGSIVHVDADGVETPVDQAAGFAEPVDPSNPYLPGAGGAPVFSAPPAPSGDFGYQAPPPDVNVMGGVNTPHPAYRNGQLHPAWGGQPLTPGGQFNTGQPSYRQQVYVPGGAAAGYDTRAARAPRGGNANYGGSGGGGASGGGGGGASSLYWAWRNKLMSKLYPGSGSGYSGSSYPSSSSAYQAPPEPKMRGFAHRFDPTEAQAFASRPSMMIPLVDKGLDSASPFYQDVASMPLGQLALLQGAHKRTTPLTSTSDYVNALHRTTSNIVNQEQLPSFDQMMHDLTHAKRNSVLGTQLQPQVPESWTQYPGQTKKNYQWYTPPLQTALGTVSSVLGAATSLGLDDRSAAAVMSYANGQLDKYGAKMAKKPPYRLKDLGRKLGHAIQGNM